MTRQVEEALSQLSPQQLDALLGEARKMANEPRPRGRKLKLDWAGSIDSEHTSGLDAQHAAMKDWTHSIERGAGK